MMILWFFVFLFIKLNHAYSVQTICNQSSSIGTNLKRNLEVVVHNAMTLSCNQGCLKIHKALLTCDPSDKTGQDDDTALARQECGDGSAHHDLFQCKLVACPVSWNNKFVECAAPVLLVTYRFIINTSS